MFSTQSNKSFLLNVQADDLSEVDLCALEADALVVAGSPAPAIDGATLSLASSPVSGVSSPPFSSVSGVALPTPSPSTMGTFSPMAGTRAAAALTATAT